MKTAHVAFAVSLVAACACHTACHGGSILSLTLEVEPQTFALGVPVPLRASLSNQGDRPVTVLLPGPIRLNMFACVLDVARRGAEFERVDYWARLPRVGVSPSVLDRGDKAVGLTTLWFRARKRRNDKRHLIFAEPGRYSLRMTYVCLVREGQQKSLTRVVSQQCEIEIGPAEAGMKGFLAVAKEHILDDGALGPAGVGPFEQFIAAGHDSVYADYARALVIKHWADELGLESLMTKLGKERTLLDWAEQLLARRGKHRWLVSEYALYLLAFNHVVAAYTGPKAQRDANLTKAQEQITALRKNFKASPLLRRLDDLRKSFEKKARRSRVSE